MNDSPIILKTPRLLLRLPVESDDVELQAFENRNLTSSPP